VKQKNNLYKKDKDTNIETVLSKAQSYCAYQERCKQEIKNKLLNYNLSSENNKLIIKKLADDNFINEKRYANTFVSGKFRIKKWGKQKIKYELKKKEIPVTYINEALSKIDDTEYLKTLKYILNKKQKLLKNTDKCKLKNKLAAYAMSKGFELELIWNILKKNY
jgi:regulatory protein